MKIYKSKNYNQKDRKIIVVNYANQVYKKSQELNCNTALNIGKADFVYSFTPEDIDSVFYKENINILSQARGAGLWLWKPYIIKKVLKEIEYNDYLLYCDSGAFFISDVHKLIYKMEDDVLCCDIPLIEEQFTKHNAFEKITGFDNKYTKTNQIIATYFVLKKTDFTVQFVEEWLSYCCDETVLSPIIGEEEINAFIAHREDQSVFSLLCKKYDIKPYRDISQRRWFPYSYKYENCNFKRHKYNKKSTVIVYLHKLKDPKLHLLLRQAVGYLWSWCKILEC